MHRQHGMALGQYEAVPIRISRSGQAQNPDEEGGDNIRNGERRPNVADVSPVSLIEDNPAEFSRSALKREPGRWTFNHQR
jgi:hypothetical protein